MKKRVLGLVSERKEIQELDYDPISQTPIHGKRRETALEEALRDLEKTPEQLLVDAHDESLGPPTIQTITRTLARMASMQLRLEKSQNQTNWILGGIAVLSLIAAITQVVIACKTLPRTNAVGIPAQTVQIQAIQNTQGILLPIAPIKPLELEVVLKKNTTE